MTPVDPGATPDPAGSDRRQREVLPPGGNPPQSAASRPASAGGLCSPAQQVVLVAAVARNGVIGAQGRLPWHLPADLRHFQALTTGHTLIMGRRTFEAIGRPLPNRRTIVLTRDPTWEAPEVTATTSLLAALREAGRGTVMIVGGAEVYEQAMELADILELTLIHQDYRGDTRFPPLAADTWREVNRIPGDSFDLVRYERASACTQTGA